MERGARRSPAPVAGSSTPPRRVPAVVFVANAASKWLVVLAQTTAVVAFRDVTSPFIVVGSIAAAFATAGLKRLINQQRPAGSPFSDPGMPAGIAI